MSTIINVIVIVEHVLSVIQEKRAQIASAICVRNNEMKKHQSSGLSGGPLPAKQTEKQKPCRRISLN